jgi:hypothetical protein
VLFSLSQLSALLFLHSSEMEKNTLARLQLLLAIHAACLLGLLSFLYFH